MPYNGNFVQITDRDLIVALSSVIRRGNIFCVDMISQYREAILRNTLYDLGVHPKREGEAYLLWDDLSRCFDDLIMDLRAGRTSIHDILCSTRRQQAWRTSIRARM